MVTFIPLLDLTARHSSSIGPALKIPLGRLSFSRYSIFNRFPRRVHFLEELSSIIFGAGGDDVSTFDAMQYVMGFARGILTQAL